MGDNPRVNSLAHENVLYIAIDHHFWIISDIESGTVDFTHKFSNTIDAFTLVDDLLLVGLGNGEVHLINVHLKEIIASWYVNESSRVFYIILLSFYVKFKHFIVVLMKMSGMEISSSLGCISKWLAVKYF